MKKTTTSRLIFPINNEGILGDPKLEMGIHLGRDKTSVVIIIIISQEFCEFAQQHEWGVSCEMHVPGRGRSERERHALGEGEEEEGVGGEKGVNDVCESQ